ncbi:HAD family hydrolase [archaeon]|jgi:phosphoglycolate phosphatase|nr:HAD family hydrolase [archaeon]MBT6824213.1 HAD family hydrolase [archaeon]MBT7106751.1 HAD family hydrolase [archaeon]MBT7297555.1 HAD family hydrolase [archaeon]
MIICFDLDGTLIDTEDWIINSLKEAYKNNNKKIPTKKQILANWGNISTVIIRKSSQEKLTKKEVENIRVEFYRIRDQSISKVKPFKNTKRVLNQLSKKYKIALVSNNNHKELLKLLKATKIDKKIFKTIIGDDEVKRAKPFPDEIYTAEKRLGKKVKFMIGDSIQDIKTAKAAKVKSIVIKTGPKETWKNLKKADFIIKDIKEIPKLIKEAKQ